MPRAIWSGAISFGLVSIPVKVYPATEDKSVAFHQVHEKDGTRIHYERACGKGHHDIPFGEIAKAFEPSKGKYVILTDEDLDLVPIPSAHTIDIAYFVDPAEIDPVLLDRGYFLDVDATGAKAYALMRYALESEGRYGIGKVAFRQKEHVALIRATDDGLVLHTLRWPDELRAFTAPALPKLTARERDMARSLVGNMTEEFNPKDFKDEYRKALLDLVKRKIAGDEITVSEDVEEAEPVTDLMEALRRSVEASTRRAKPKGPAKRTKHRKAS